MNQIIINTLANCDSAWCMCVLPFFTRRMYLSLSTAAPQNGHGFGTWSKRWFYQLSDRRPENLQTRPICA